MEERIERRMRAEGYDLQSDEGATEFQHRLDRELEEAKRMICRQSKRQPALKSRGVAI